MPEPPPHIELISFLLPIINIAVSLPLCLRMVPPNRLYGFRTRKTLSNPDTWYEANYKGGAGLIIASVLSLVARAFLLHNFDRGTGMILSVFVLLGCMVVALVVWGIQVRSM